MDKLRKAATIYNNLINKEIKIVIGRKGKKTDLYIDFSVEDFYHLVGFHYLKDLRNIARMSSKIAFEKILNDEITISMLEKSKYFNQIEDRIECILLFSKVATNVSSVYKFRRVEYSFSKINWEYLITFPTEISNAYLFLRELRKNPNHFICVSTFENTGYERNQIKYTLLEVYLIDENQERLLYKYK
ncbi:PBECR4 domain-containing protein (plasmid) [Fructilactobacillus sp. Tb1]|uniref:PBECR4 domain-containing protein n=1 Tax=Fructilactobacillus sp. Tb1 TaxID=3422304 RepID=UPI003D2D5A34